MSTTKFVPLTTGYYNVNCKVSIKKYPNNATFVNEAATVSIGIFINNNLISTSKPCICISVTNVPIYDNVVTINETVFMHNKDELFIGIFHNIHGESDLEIEESPQNTFLEITRVR